MVAQANRREAWALACELVLIVAAREHLWPYVPVHLQGMASKGLGAALVLVLLSVIHRLALRLYGPSKVLAGVLLVAAFYSLQTLLCSAAYMVEPWELQPGHGICSGRVGIDLGALGLLAVAFLAYRLIPVRIDTTTKQE